MTRATKVVFGLIFGLIATGIPAQSRAAGGQPTVIPNHRWGPANSVFPLFHPELRYRLFDRFTHSRFCDPYGVGPASAAAETRDAVSVFHKIQEDRPTFTAITKHLGLAGKREFSTDDKLAIYLQYLKLRDTVRLLPENSSYTFELLRREDKPQKPPLKPGWGLRVTGVITPWGKINVLRTEPAPVYCPGSRQVD